MAYCQPGVAAFFNFEIADEPGLGGWQSGLLWTDFTPKPSYQPFKDAVRTVASRQVDCNRYTQLSAGAATGAEIGFSSGPDKPQAPTRPAPPPKKKGRCSRSSSLKSPFGAPAGFARRCCPRISA